MQSLKQRLRSLKLNGFLIEIVIFFSFMGLSSMYVSEHAILYDTVCHQTLDHTEADQGCNLTKNSDARRRVQASSSTWTSILSLTYIGPAVLSENILGAWSDRYGRKDCLLLALASVITTTVPDALITYYVRAPLYTLIASSSVSAISGSGSTIMSLSLAYVADTTSDKRTMTYRMTVAFMCKSLGAVAGAFLLGSVRPMLSFSENILIAQSVLIIAFFYTLIKMPQKPVVHAHFGHPYPYHSDQHKSGHVEKRSFRDKIMELIRHAMESNRVIWSTLFRRRRGKKRLYLLVITVIYFCYVMSEFSLLNGPVMSFYGFDHPFYWSASDLSRFRGTQNLTTLIGTILGLLFIQKFNVLADTALILLALVSGFAYLVIVGCARSTWHLYIGATLGTFNTLIIPATKSFIAQQVNSDEVGKVLAMNGVTAELAFAVTRLIFTNVYGATVQTELHGFVFLLGAGVIGCCFVPAIWIHLSWMRRRRKIRQMIGAGKVAKFGIIMPIGDEPVFF